MRFGKWCISHDIHIYFQHIWIIYIYDHSYLPIGTHNTKIATILIWGHFIKVFSDQSLRITLGSGGLSRWTKCLAAEI